MSHARTSRIAALAGAALMALTTSTSAQVTPNSGATPEQMQAIMNMRALQMRGRGQIRTGVPQDIQFGPGAFGQGFDPGIDPSQAQFQGDGGGGGSSSKKRIEARKAREEQKRAAREDAKAKKGAKAEPAKKAKKDPPAKKLAPAAARKGDKQDVAVKDSAPKPKAKPAADEK